MGNSKVQGRGWRATSCSLLLALALFLSGCAGQAPDKSGTEDPAAAANDILFNALGLVGTPYRYGGSSPDSGFDCSGLIRYVYLQGADLNLPRTVAELNALEAPDIAEDKLQSGDLVIFATNGDSRPSHAGIYVGEGRFVHAPSRGGAVRMDWLNDTYWQRCYLSAKRPLAAR